MSLPSPVNKAADSPASRISGTNVLWFIKTVKTAYGSPLLLGTRQVLGVYQTFDPRGWKCAPTLAAISVASKCATRELLEFGYIIHPLLAGRIARRVLPLRLQASNCSNPSIFLNARMAGRVLLRLLGRAPPFSLKASRINRTHATFRVPA